MSIGTTEPFIIARVIDAPIATLWIAITDKNEMKKWYFDLAEFKAEVGFKFQFTGGAENQFLHLCEVTEVIPYKKLTYSWRYDGYEGITYVTFELFEDGGKTKIKLTHKGLETFPSDVPDFAETISKWVGQLLLEIRLVNYFKAKKDSY